MTQLLFLQGFLTPETTQWIILGALIIVFYLFFIRPQQKKAKEGKTFLESLKPGDKIVSVGGVHGRILKEEGTTFIVEIDKNVKMKLEKSAISMEMTAEAIKPKEEVTK
jgi:preprotein translocase subunit YajC